MTRFEVRTEQQVRQSYLYYVTVKEGTEIPTDAESWADILYNGADGFTVSSPIHDHKMDEVDGESVVSVVLGTMIVGK
jgi:hypothetical protein